MLVWLCLAGGPLPLDSIFSHCRAANEIYSAASKLLISILSMPIHEHASLEIGRHSRTVKVGLGKTIILAKKQIENE
jgi:hypothetical protein